MHSPSMRWKKLLLFCLGLALGAGFCMKWIETDFLYSGGRFTILGLEWFYPKDKVIYILRSMDPVSGISLEYHLYFDFVFMAGVYPAIAAYGVLIAIRSGEGARKCLIVLAAFQLLAWLSDIGENYYLLHWLRSPDVLQSWQWYHTLVAVKWLIVIAGIILPSIVWLFSIRKRK